MAETSRPDCVAIDGGGTRCRFVVSINDLVQSVEGGTANVSSDFDKSVATILSGLNELAALTGRDIQYLTSLPAFVGLAGVTGPAMVERLKTALPFVTARYADDRPAALRGALGSQNGIVAHCGTGSFLAAQFESDIRLAGGWGPVLGDEGSAQLVGRRLLWLTLQCVDGFHSPTPLTDAVISRFGSAPEIVSFAGSANPHELGALAPMVTDAAADDDPSAQFLLKEAAALVALGIRQIGWSPGLAICLTGGIAPFYGPYLPDDMQADIRPHEADPIEGALALAADLARKSAS